MTNRESQSSTCADFAKFFLFGTSSWILVTAIYAQMSVMKTILPEGDKLYSRVDLAMELGNIVPAILLFSGFQPSVLKHLRAYIYGILFVAIATALLYSTSWRVTVSFGEWGGDVSVVVIICSWLAGVVGSMAMITYFAFANEYGKVAIAALAAGVGGCGFITNILGVVQGLSELKKSNQSVEVLHFQPSSYFLIVSGVLGVGCLSLMQVAKRDLTEVEQVSPKDSQEFHLLPTNEDDSLEAGSETPSKTDREENLLALFIRNKYVLSNIFVTCFTQFAVPGLLPYLVPCKGVSETFWMTVSYLSGSLLGRLVTLVRMSQRLIILNVLQSLIFVYALVIARAQTKLYSQLPRDTHCNFASQEVVPFWLSVILMATFSALHGHIVAVIFQFTGEDEAASSWAGLFNQGGAALGAVFSFILVQLGAYG